MYAAVLSLLMFTAAYHDMIDDSLIVTVVFSFARVHSHLCFWGHLFCLVRGRTMMW
jgi:hypothetical protein